MPTSLENLFHFDSNSRHRLQSEHKLSVPKARTELFTKSWHTVEPNWNTLPSDAKISETMGMLKRKVTKFVWQASLPSWVVYMQLSHVKALFQFCNLYMYIACNIMSYCFLLCYFKWAPHGRLYTHVNPLCIVPMSLCSINVAYYNYYYYYYNYRRLWSSSRKCPQLGT